jgi:hypothetical protein
LLLGAAATTLIFGLQRDDSFLFFLAGSLGGFGLGAVLAAQLSGRGVDSEVSELLIRIVSDLPEEKAPLEPGASKLKLLEAGALDWEYLLARDPQLALAKVRIDLETTLNKLVPTTEAFASPLQVVRQLARGGRIDQATADALEDVLRVCNYAVHGRFEPTIHDARSTLDLARRVLVILGRLTEKSEESRSRDAGSESGATSISESDAGSP